MIRNKLILLMSLWFYVSHGFAEEPDWNSYQQVLNHLIPGVKNSVELMQVDYITIKKNGSLDKAYQELSSFKIEKLSNRNEMLAFYINAYNILALKKVVDHWPIESIKDLGGFFSPVWDKHAGFLNGKPVTLGHIEHEILRPMSEPRIHLAIVCASVSCPDLRNEPYIAKKLDQQLDDQTRLFLNNSQKGLRLENRVIRLSRIFDWFEEDFDRFGGIAEFIKYYRADLPLEKLKANIPYDWSVNGVQ